MKKMKTVALAMIVAVALVGAGYAAWGTEIFNETTINSGNWSIILENDASDSVAAGDTVYNFVSDGNNNESETGVLSKENEVHDILDPSNQAGARKSNPNNNYVYTMAPVISGDTISFDFYNMHPGTEANTTFEMRNYGSIPAKVANVDVVLNNGAALSTKQQQLKEAIEVSGKLVDHIGSPTFNEIGTIPAGTKLSDLESVLEGILDDALLSPQQSIHFGYRDGSELEVQGLSFKIPADALDGNIGMNAKLPIKIKFDFAQYNQVPAGN